MKNIYIKYLNNELKLETWQKIGVICLVIVITGIFGWLYEFIFYYFNSGMKEFYWRGANFLPWINIYATGSIMIMILSIFNCFYINRNIRILHWSYYV